MHLFVFPAETETPLPTVAGITVSRLPRDTIAAARAIDAVLQDSNIATLAFWDLRLGAVPSAAIARFVASLDDAWHPGSRLTGLDEPDLLRHVEPLWVNRPSPAPDVVGAVSWRLDLRATFVRAQAVRQLGGFDPAFDTLAGMARDLGLRLLKRGGVCRQQPDLIASSPIDHDEPSLADRYRLVGRHFSEKWRAYTFARRLVELPSLSRELDAVWRSSVRAVPPVPVGALHRDLTATRLPQQVAVSVVLPTLGRYEYVAEVLDDLRAQTVRPTQILIADGNAVEDRQPEVYERYADLPIEVLWHDAPGACGARNVCLPHVTGDYVWFVDDDSRFAADNLEVHLRVMLAYGADVSVGPAYTKNRPELHPEQREIACGFMDCGTTVITRSMLATIGGFDMQFSDNLPYEDSEFGLRVVRAGGLMLNNPLAKRFHYLAPRGGCRVNTNSTHRWSRWSLSVPRPIHSIYYTARRHFESAAMIDAMFQAGLLVGWRRPEGQRATPAWRLRTLVEELAAMPVTALRLRRSIELGKQMVDEGPQIPPLAL